MARAMAVESDAPAVLAFSIFVSSAVLSVEMHQRMGRQLLQVGSHLPFGVVDKAQLAGGETTHLHTPNRDLV